MSKHTDLPVVSHSWTVAGSVKPTEENGLKYKENFYIGVVAPTMEEALTRARIVFKDGEFFSVHHRGPVHIR